MSIRTLSAPTGERIRPGIAAAPLLLLAVLAAPVAGQADPAGARDTARAATTGPLRLGGTVGAAVEGYGMSGAGARRPGAASRLYADLTFSLLGLSSGLNLLLTTEEAGNRQALNRLGYSGSWAWGQLQLGDANLSYSPYSVQGTTLRGGALELRPGPFLLSAAYGQTRRAAKVLPGVFSEPGYDRTLAALRLGAGRSHGTHLHLIGVGARDRGVSDSARGAPTKENLSLTPDAGLVLFGGAFRLMGTATVSAVTRERSSTEIAALEDAGVKVLTEAFTPRVGSRVDYAGQVSAEWRAGGSGVHASYERVNPGFESLGVGYLRSDRETVRVRPRTRLGRKIQLDGTFATSRDNLRSDRLATQRRSEAGLNAQTQLGRLTLGGGYLLFLNQATPQSDSAALRAPARRQRMHSLTLTPALALPGTRATQLVTATFAAQRLTDESPTDAAAPIYGFDNLSATINYVLALSSGLSVNAGGTWLRNDADVAVTQVTGLTAGAGWQRGRFGLTASTGISGTRTELETADQRARQLRLDLDAAYRHGRAGTLRLGLHGLSNTPSAGAGTGFRELRSELRYERTFATR